MKKLYLVTTSFDEEKQGSKTDCRIDDTPNSHYTMGIPYLEAYLEKNNSNCMVSTAYLNGVEYNESMKRLKNDIKSLSPDVVGISMVAHSRFSSFRLIEYLEKKYPKIKILVGGVHVGGAYSAILKRYNQVIACIGEGEIVLSELMNAFEEGTPLSEIPGIAYFEDGEIKKNPLPKLISDLDSLPFPKHESFLVPGRTQANMLTSRGCPLKCSFCMLDILSRRNVRYRSAKNVVDEIEHLLSINPNLKEVWFHDDAFMINKKVTEELCDEIIRRDVHKKGLYFVCSARFSSVNDRLVGKMVKAGFTHILLGLESGADEVMRKMNKKITKEMVMDAVKVLSNHKIKITLFLIVGLEGETAKSVKETAKFVQELQGVHYFLMDDFAVANVYPGTELYEVAKRGKMHVEGYGPIDDDFWAEDNVVPKFTVENSIEVMNEWKQDIMDTISFTQVTSGRPSAFLRQRKLFPGLVEFAWKWQFAEVTYPMISILQQNNQLVNKTIEDYFANDKSVKDLMVLNMEKRYMQQILNNMPAPDHEKFIQKYNDQLVLDTGE